MRIIDADELKKKLKRCYNKTTTAPNFDFVTKFDIDECPTIEPYENKKIARLHQELADVYRQLERQSERRRGTTREIEEAIEVIKAYKDNLTNSVSNQLDGDIKAFEMAISALKQMPEVTSTMQTGQFSFAELTKGMREVTPEESKSIEEYLSRTSKKTGVNIFDLEDVEDEIDFIQEHKKIPVKLDLEPCEDAVSRQDVLDLVVGEISHETYEGIYELPSVTVRQNEITLESAIDYLHKIGWMQEHDRILSERQTGEWIELPKALDANENPCKCSACGHILSFMHCYPKSNFCPNCGADMRGDGE